MQHFHSQSLGIAALHASDFHMSVGKGKLVLNLARNYGSLWKTSLKR